ncbi:MAG: 16S rRNA (guanine(966)-N(2))-methyltransferase RsmD [Verrucomicrobia bacterium]|nr:16S rRNA (guanine(966)-N(2))-methyltransferase RsmD [Verrucomicrobiota bacterium]
MKIIAGSAGGIRLNTPPHHLRPTMDMVREAAFSSLADLVAGSRVLDLFAGSGAYGIEALSRGASEAVFVDNHPKSIETIRSNFSKTKLTGRVIADDVFRFLRRQDERYRLVFADPPYAKKATDRDFVGELMENESLPAAVEPGGLLVLECSPTKQAKDFRFWEVTRAKKYGATNLLFCVPKKLSR